MKTILIIYGIIVLISFFIGIFITLYNNKHKNTKEKIVNKKSSYKKRTKHPIYFLIIILILLLFPLLYILFNNKPIKYPLPKNNNKTIEKSSSDNKQDNSENNFLDINTSSKNLFEEYGNYKLEDINFNTLKETNSDITAWLIVDKTNINYPIVQTTDNEYYLNNNILKEKASDGWPFMDYRNSKMLSDNNTIFYGHNLLNKTSFGSISNIFTKKWYNESNHEIVVLTANQKYVYEIFSCYYTGDEVDYLQNIFYGSNEYETFLNNIKQKSKFKFDIPINSNENIITLSTCTEDNKGRKVVHAKFVRKEPY